MKILVTGAAGFIGFHLCNALLKSEAGVVGTDNLNDYYDVGLKNARLDILREKVNFQFFRISLEDRERMSELFKTEKFDYVVNLAAQAGIQYSLRNPHAYVDSNLVGFLNVLEGCRNNEVKHLVYASSSSVYGLNTSMPFSVHHNVDHPISLHAATKKANELMAHTYSYLYKIPVTGLRFFTVYGPWGRPDMVLFKFTKAILQDQPIEVYNFGNAKRDFTYVDDIVEGVIRVMKRIPGPDPGWSGDNPDPASSCTNYRLYNIGNNNPVDLMRFISALESCIGKKAKKNLLPLPPGDLPATYADVDDLIADIGFKPQTPIETGISRFMEWYRDYYK